MQNGVTTTYQQLSDKHTHQKLDELKDQLQHLFQNPSAAIQNTLQDIEHKYFNRSFKTTHRIPTFYGLVKIHKTPWTLRPVVSCCGSLLATVSTWIDFHLQRIRHTLPTFIKDSHQFQKELSRIKVPKNTKIFTCDAISMYTNIDIDHRIAIIHAWFEEFHNELPTNLPTNLILTVLDIVMKNNIFTFGDTNWLNLKGTAMGTPCACMVASLNFAYHERKIISDNYKEQIIFYKRFIDDVFCLWNKRNQQTNINSFTNFQNDMNNFGSVRWEFEPLTTKTTFLDLTITLLLKHTSHRSIDDFYSIQFQTFQKPMNLYLYIPPHSAHPPGTIRSLVYNQLRKY